jgi:arsenate reductase
MADVTIWHNPNCTSSKTAMTLAAGSGVDVEERRYLKDSPSRAELLDVLAILEDPAADLVRKDQRFAELGLDPADYTTAEEVATLLAEEPRLIQRPVLIRGDRAVIGRPRERAEAFLRGDDT